MNRNKQKARIDTLLSISFQNPDCAPEENRPRYRPPKQRKNKRKNRPTAQRRTREIPDRWEDSDTDMESHYIKVEQARKDVAEMSDDDDESDSDDVSSDTSVEVKRKVAAKKVKGSRRAPKPSQRTKKSGTKRK